MARWHSLEKTRPLKWKHGCIEHVLHVWPHRPPSDEEWARGLARQFLLTFGSDLLARLARRSASGVPDQLSVEEGQASDEASGSTDSLRVKRKPR